ncbi:AHH domain-containing protein [Alkalimonas amylolytica]|uniref:A nuclease family of the HNH/ENDO VII superfamily with conserved AHH n=1 Tax=Alkalimonas amylolytica TaxID=152573 RepID=A0A1H4EHY5_ALKAM|nr:AHH domain-containing protein [Alkalimonas amylolytica]SEA84645.1 A nuclease family of the HNH/ENDO VII superfamily with conserved AHH [Alkalimonas amylolytica]
MEFKKTPHLSHYSAPERPLNPSPLEMIIYLYEQKAHHFHHAKHQSASKSETSAQRAEREAKRTRDWKHLRLERRKIVAHIKLQESLAAYREESKTKNIRELVAEEHHPTKKLARNLRAAGEPKPTPIHEAHHIIPGSGKHRRELMLQSRLNLHGYGVGINDPLNGIWLRNFAKNTPDDWATPESPPHRPIHTYNYETWIAAMFSNDNLPESVFLSRLRTVKRKLKDGTFPPNILEKRNN